MDDGGCSRIFLQPERCSVDVPEQQRRTSFLICASTSKVKPCNTEEHFQNVSFCASVQPIVKGSKRPAVSSKRAPAKRTSAEKEEEVVKGEEEAIEEEMPKKRRKKTRDEEEAASSKTVECKRSPRFCSFVCLAEVNSFCPHSGPESF